MRIYFLFPCLTLMNHSQMPAFPAIYGREQSTSIQSSIMVSISTFRQILCQLSTFKQLYILLSNSIIPMTIWPHHSNPCEQLNVKSTQISKYFAVNPRNQNHRCSYNMFFNQCYKSKGTVNHNHKHQQKFIYCQMLKLCNMNSTKSSTTVGNNFQLELGANSTIYS